MLKGRQWNESSWELLRSVVAMRTSGIAAKFVLKMAIDLSLNDTTKRVIYVSINFDFFFVNYKEIFSDKNLFHVAKICHCE